MVDVFWNHSNPVSMFMNSSKEKVLHLNILILIFILKNITILCFFGKKCIKHVALQLFYEECRFYSWSLSIENGRIKKLLSVPSLQKINFAENKLLQKKYISLVASNLLFKESYFLPFEMNRMKVFFFLFKNQLLIQNTSWKLFFLWIITEILSFVFESNIMLFLFLNNYSKFII